MLRLAAFLFLSTLLYAEESPSIEEGVLQSSPVSHSISSDEVALVETLPSLSVSRPIVQPMDGIGVMPMETRKSKSPFVAVMLSSFVPGLGHYYLGEARTGSEILGGVLVGGAGTFLARNDPSLFATGIYATQAVSWYGIYAVYRDVKLYNGDPVARMPRDNFKSLSAAPFQWSVLKKPAVWGGFLGAVAGAVALGYFTSPDMSIKTHYIEPLSALPIAIGEESFFRGFLQTSLLDTMPPWAAIACSSLVFGAAHIPNASLLEGSDRDHYYAFSLPFITTLGAYMGWLTYEYSSLKESVAFHAWYDFSLMCMKVLATKAATREAPVNLTYSFEF